MNPNLPKQLRNLPRRNGLRTARRPRVKKTSHAKKAPDQERQERRRLDKKDGRGLVKDAPTGIKETTGPDVTNGVADSVATEWATTSGIKKERRKGKEVLTDENEDLNDPDILDAAHKFAVVVKIRHYVRIMRRNHRGSGLEGFSVHLCNKSKIYTLDI